ncbi:hypothetical protein ALC60_10003, partial [Trachymyrmex zeteki]
FFATVSIESQETASVSDEVRSMQRSITNLLALHDTEHHCIYALCAHALSAISTEKLLEKMNKIATSNFSVRNKTENLKFQKKLKGIHFSTPDQRDARKEEGDRTRDMVYACDYASPWWETTTTISIDGGDTLDLRFSRSRRNLTACTLIVTSSLLENDTGELYREERGDASSRRGNGGVLRNAKLRALKAKDVYHGCFIRIINSGNFYDHFQPIRNSRSSVDRYEHLLSTIRRGGRAELARAEPSDTELRVQRGEPLCESSLRRPGIWILLLIGRDLTSLRDLLVGVERSIN